MPKPELYVIYTGNKGKKNNTISLSQEFFDGADINIEIKAKVIYESDKDNIINEYIVFCNRIRKNRNILKQYLSNKEVEVITIMMSLFDDEQIMKSFIRSERHEAAQESAKETVKRMIKMGKLSLDEIVIYVPALSMEELKEIEAEVMQMA